MTFGELKDEIFALNWESVGGYNGDKGLICFAVNRAVSVISSEVSPILGELVISQVEAPDKGSYVRYKLKELTSEDGANRFRSLEEVYWGTADELPPLGGVKLEKGSVLCVPRSYKGEIRVVYRRSYTPVTLDTQDSFELELDEEVCVLIPLLAAYFVWLDDDRSRAQEYYNQYEMRRDRLSLRSKGPVANIVVGRSF